MAHDWLDRLRKAWSRRASDRRERDRARFGVGAADFARRQFRWAEAARGYGGYLAARPADAAIVARQVQTLISAGKIAQAQAALQAGLDKKPDSGALDRVRIDLEMVERRLAGLDLPLSRAIPSPPAMTPEEAKAEAGAVLRLAPGAVALPDARAWLGHALVTTGAAAVYGDHRVGVDGTPVLFGAAHVEDLRTLPQPPVMALFAASAAPDESLDLRHALIAAFEIGPVVHVPLVLAETALVSGVAPVMPDDTREAAAPPRILVIVPTRDEGRMLEALIESLRATADHPDLFDLKIVDNGSRDPDTLALLQAWRGEGAAEVLRIDAPFNWSDLNNRAAMGATQDILLFINNDMVMQTDGWDARLRAHLSRPNIGVVGVRLLYPAGNIQHAGLALGVLDADDQPGGPLHEGLGAGAQDRGPLNRWARTRPAAAVTGAFMGVRREIFEAVGGFDAVNFPVSCNDVDFCLRVRERGLTVLYVPEIELIHDESHTRGHDDSQARQARAVAERTALARLWGDDARRDPSRNPHWVAHETLIFSGLRQPDGEAVVAEIARAGSLQGGDLWRTRRRSQGPS